MKGAHLFCILLAGLVAFSSAANGNTNPAKMPPHHLVLLTENDPPLSFIYNGSVDGLMVNVVQEIQHRLGNTDQIMLWPWARAYREAQIQPNVALFSTVRTQEREKLFKWIGPVVEMEGCLYAHSNSTARPDSIAAAKALPHLVVVRNWYLQQMLTQAGFTNLVMVKTPEQMIDLLLHHRTDVIASESITLPYQMRLLGEDPQNVVKTLVFAHNEGYIAFSLSTPDDVVKAWQASLDSLKKDGTLERIYQKWLPEEKVPLSIVPSH